MSKNDFNRIIKPYELFSNNDLFPVLLDAGSVLSDIKIVTSDNVPAHIESLFGRKLLSAHHVTYSISAEKEREITKQPKAQVVSVSDAQKYISILTETVNKLSLSSDKIDLLQLRLKKKANAPLFLATAFETTLTSLGYKLQDKNIPNLLSKLTPKECDLFLDTLLSNVVVESNYHVLQLHFSALSGSRDKDDIVTLFLGRDGEYEKRLNEWNTLTRDPRVLDNDYEKYMDNLLKTMFSKRGSLPVEDFQSDTYKVSKTSQYYSPALNMFLEKVDGTVLVEYFNNDTIRVHDPSTTISLSELKTREEQIADILKEEFPEDSFNDDVIEDEEVNNESLRKKTKNKSQEQNTLYYKEYSASQLSRELPGVWKQLVDVLGVDGVKSMNKETQIEIPDSWLDEGLKKINEAFDAVENTFADKTLPLSDEAKVLLRGIAEDYQVSLSQLERFYETGERLAFPSLPEVFEKIESCVHTLEQSGFDSADFSFEELDLTSQEKYLRILAQYNISPDIMDLRLSFPDEFQKNISDFNTMCNLGVLLGEHTVTNIELSSESKDIFSYFATRKSNGFFNTYISNGPEQELLSIVVRFSDALQNKILPPEKKYDNTAHLELTNDIKILPWNEVVSKYSISDDTLSSLNNSAFYYVHEIFHDLTEKLTKSFAKNNTPQNASPLLKRVPSGKQSIMVDYPLYVLHDERYHHGADQHNRWVSTQTAVEQILRGFSPNFGVLKGDDDTASSFKPIENALLYFITETYPPFRVMQDQKMLSSFDYLLSSGKRHLHMIYAPVGENDVILLKRDNNGDLEYYKNKRDVTNPLSPLSVTKRIFTQEDVDYYCDKIDYAFVKNMFATRQNELISSLILKQYHADVNKFSSLYTGDTLQKKVALLDALYRDPDYNAILSERFSHYMITEAYQRLCGYVDNNYFDPVFMSRLVSQGFNEVVKHSKNLDVIKDTFSDYISIVDITPINIAHALTPDNIKTLTSSQLLTLLLHDEFIRSCPPVLEKLFDQNPSVFKEEVKKRDPELMKAIAEGVISFYSSSAASMTTLDFKNKFCEFVEDLSSDSAADVNLSNPYSVLQGLVTLQDLKDNVFSLSKLRTFPISSLQDLHNTTIRYFEEFGKDPPQSINYDPYRTLYVESATNKLISIQGDFLDSTALFPENTIAASVVAEKHPSIHAIISSKVEQKMIELGIIDKTSVEYSYLSHSFFLHYLKTSTDIEVRNAYITVKNDLEANSFLYARSENAKSISDAVGVYNTRIGGRMSLDEARAEIEGVTALPVFYYIENSRKKNDIFDSFIALEDKNVYFSSTLGIYVSELPGYKDNPAVFSIYDDFAAADGSRNIATKERILPLIENTITPQYTSNEFGKEIARRLADKEKALLNSSGTDAQRERSNLLKKTNMNLLHYMPDMLEPRFIHDSVYRVNIPLKVENKSYYVRVRFNPEIPLFTFDQLREKYPELNNKLHTAVLGFFKKIQQPLPPEDSTEYKRKYVDLFSQMPEFSAQYTSLSHQIKQKNDPRYEYALVDTNPYDNGGKNVSFTFKGKTEFLLDMETFLKIHAVEERVYFLNLPNMNFDNRINAISMVKENEERIAFETLVLDKTNYRNFKYNVPPSGHILDPIYTLGWNDVVEQKQTGVMPTDTINILKDAINSLNQTTGLLLHAAGRRPWICDKINSIGFYEKDYLWHSTISSLFENQNIFSGLRSNEVSLLTLENIKKITQELNTLYANSVDDHDSLSTIISNGKSVVDVMCEKFSSLEKLLVENYRFLFSVTTPENEHFYCIVGYEQTAGKTLGVSRFLVSPTPIEPSLSLNEMETRMVLGGTTTYFANTYGVSRVFDTEDTLIAQVQPDIPALFDGGASVVKEFTLPTAKRPKENKEVNIEAQTLSFD